MRLPGIFTHRKNKGNIETLEDGSVVKTQPIPTHPKTGKPFEFFQAVDVRLLRDHDRDVSGDAFYKKGEIHSVEMTPNGHFHLLERNSCVVFNSTPVEGVDFEYV